MVAPRRPTYDEPVHGQGQEAGDGIGNGITTSGTGTLMHSTYLSSEDDDSEDSPAYIGKGDETDDYGAEEEEEEDEEDENEM